MRPLCIIKRLSTKRLSLSTECVSIFKVNKEKVSLLLCVNMTGEDNSYCWQSGDINADAALNVLKPYPLIMLLTNYAGLTRDILLSS